MRISRAGRITASRTRICAVLLAATLAGMTACSSVDTAAPAARSAAPASSAPAANLAAPYQSKDGYSISPPTGWIYHPVDSQRGVSSIFGAPGRDAGAKAPFVDNINVVITPTTSDLGAVIAATKQQYPGILTNYQVTTDEPTTVNNRPAYLLGGTYDDPKSGPLQNIQVILVDAGKAYSITFTSAAATFASLKQIATASLNSFTLG